ncbi:hypothetical protein [Tessaracoccus lacteus]|uniref:Uncharacterized protein n=1 Tax=Tessaracoccus lacteus TaxID=3041766 RepID=A0ABY8Q0X3_9ACTN|nr:hypothetical protein [Tessaracoccus sp. T21]WGT48475.1 hypothetical protein QH948_06975 [Tessaracoccus sp. T21]
MTLTFAAVMADAGIEAREALVIRHAYVREHEDGSAGIHGDSSDEEILAYTRVQDADPRRFPKAAPGYWIVFVPEGGDRARLWSVVVNRGEVANDGVLRTFDLERSDVMGDLRNRLVIGWRVSADVADQRDDGGDVSGDGDRRRSAGAVPGL